MNLKKIAKRVIPNALWGELGLLRRRWLARNDSKMTTREVFTRIYENKVWAGGGDDGEFCSGTGSRNKAVVAAYVDAVRSWYSNHGAPGWVALDVGCGDFHVGREICGVFDRYIAVDVVPTLVEFLRAGDVGRHVEFRCVDAIEEPLPPADVVFFRQVLQHLSNEQIGRIVPKIRRFRNAIVTEHLPTDLDSCVYNLDKVQGGGIRIDKGSGIDLERAPFDLNPKASSVLLEVPAGDSDKDGIIRTTWYRFD